MNTFAGQCHCGALGVSFSSARRADQLPVRACACSFCRRHGALSTSDPAGTLEFIAHDASVLVRYRFGLGTADFWVCARCGVYLGAVMDGAYGIVNVRALDERDAFTCQPAPFDYDGETALQRRARRVERWTPAVIRSAG